MATSRCDPHGVVLGIRRLGRRLCENCKQPADYPRESMLRAGYKPEELDGTWKPYRAVGCSACNNGYKGRVGIYELMVMNEDLKRAVARGARTDDIRNVAIQGGMLTLKDYAMVLMAEGLTSVDEVLQNLVVSN